MAGKPSDANFEDMGPQDLRAWLDLRRTRLAEHTVFVQRYLDRRAMRQVHTYTDDQYEAFQGLAADLLQLLDVLIDNLDRDQEGGAIS
jgi:hypothetical protein